MEVEIYFLILTVFFIMTLVYERKFFFKKEKHIQMLSESLKKSFMSNLKLNNEIKNLNEEIALLKIKIYKLENGDKNIDD